MNSQTIGIHVQNATRYTRKLIMKNKCISRKNMFNYIPSRALSSRHSHCSLVIIQIFVRKYSSKLLKLIHFQTVLTIIEIVKSKKQLQ